MSGRKVSWVVEGGCAAESGLEFPIGFFGVEKVLVISPDKPRGPKGHLTNTGIDIRPIPYI